MKVTVSAEETVYYEKEVDITEEEIAALKDGSINPSKYLDGDDIVSGSGMTIMEVEYSSVTFMEATACI